MQELLQLQHIYKPDFRWFSQPAIIDNFLPPDYLVTAKVEFSLSGNLVKVVPDIQSKQASLFNLEVLKFFSYCSLNLGIKCLRKINMWDFNFRIPLLFEVSSCWQGRPILQMKALLQSWQLESKFVNSLNIWKETKCFDLKEFV